MNRRGTAGLTTTGLLEVPMHGGNVTAGSQLGSRNCGWSRRIRRGAVGAAALAIAGLSPAPSLAGANDPDAVMDIEAVIPQPATSGIADDTLAKARVNVYRTSQVPRTGILIRVEGFGSSGVNTNESNAVQLPKGDDNPSDDPALRSARDDKGFDIYRVEWYDGTTYIQKNAMVLVELLRRIREGGLQGETIEGVAPDPEAPLGPDEVLVLLGESMGGLVTRYALAYLEYAGVDHRVDLWMTMDSPHVGAYIPIGVQYMMKYLTGLFGTGVAQQQWDEVNSPAARQMLLYHYTEANNSSTPGHSPLFDDFWDDLNNTYGGYPHAPGLWKVAVSNGRDDGKTADSISGTDVAFSLPKGEARLLTAELSERTVESYLESLKIRNPLNDKTVYSVTVPVEIGIGTTLDVWSLRPSLNNGLVFQSRAGLILRLDGKTTSVTEDSIRSRIKKILDVPSWIPDGWVNDALTFVVDSIVDKLSGISAGVLRADRVDADYAWDFVPGGLSDKTQSAGDAFRIKVSSADVISPKHCFIPATSALGLTGNPTRALRDLTAQDTPFDAIYIEPPDPGNRSHVQYNKHTGKVAFETELNRILEVPSIRDLVPPRLPETSPQQSINVFGINFTTNTVVRWNDSPRSTTFVDENHLFVTIPASDLAAPGIANVTLEDPVSDVTGLSTTAFEVVDVAFLVSPTSPAPGEHVYINYTGVWQDSCIPEDPFAVVAGTTILLQATTPPPTPQCSSVESPYELDWDVGPLPGGMNYQVMYEVNGTMVANGFFDVLNPVPVITGVDPPEVSSGDREITLRILGEAFLRDPDSPSNSLSRVYWNGTRVPATILSSSLLLADIAPELLGAQRTNELAVFNLGPGGGYSYADVPYTAPRIDSAVLVNPSPDNGSLQLHIRGPNLEEGSTLWWNGVALASELDRDGDLVALVPGQRLAEPGAGAITVVDSNGMSSVSSYVEFVPPPEVRYVKPDTPDGDDGLSWATAYDDLQTALAAVTASQELWVAEGTYLTSATGDPTNHFTLVNGVEIYGGFRGNEVLRGQRNPDPFSNHTVLSGDQWQNGRLGTNYLDNSYHVIVCTNVSPATTLDGFTITGGYRPISANDSESSGAGIWVVAGAPVLRNLLITDNGTRYGGGMSIDSSFGAETTRLERVTFLANIAFFGGGLRTQYVPVSLTDVDFVENVANWQGAGMQQLQGECMLERVRFLGNNGQDGGGLWTSGILSIDNALFAGNYARKWGGAIHTGTSSPQVTLHNVTLCGNQAVTAGGAIHNDSAGPALYHSIIWNNTAPSNPVVDGVSLDAASAYNTIEGGSPTGSNVWTNDPGIVRMPNPGDGRWDTPADNDYGNLRLRTGSPVVDAGDTNLLPTGVTTDLAGNPRVAGTSVDFGAYEGAFVTFADLYPLLQPGDDANLDHVANAVPYLAGDDPEAPPPLAGKPRLVREGDRLYLEYAIRTTAGDFRLAFDQSDALPHWRPLPADLGNAMVVDEIQEGPDGIQWRRVRLLVDPEFDRQGYIHSYAWPLGF